MFCKNTHRTHPFTKAIRNTLVKGALAACCSVVAFSCRPGLVVGQVITELNYIAIENVGPRGNRGEVGIFNCPWNQNYYIDLHTRKIKSVSKYRKLRWLIEHSIAKSKRFGQKMDLNRGSFSFSITCV